MKRWKIVVLFVFISAFVSYSICQRKKEMINVSDLVISNVEALANNGEDGGLIYCCLGYYGACKNGDTVKGPLVICNARWM